MPETETLARAAEVRTGDHLYDNRHADWLLRWPMVVSIEPISAGRLAITTTGRLFIALPTEPLLAKRKDQ